MCSCQSTVEGATLFPSGIESKQGQKTSAVRIPGTGVFSFTGSLCPNKGVTLVVLQYHLSELKIAMNL